MQFRYQYYGKTTTDNSDTAQAFSFAPDTLRPPTFFEGQLRPGAHLAFREALSALHAVVVSDQRYRGRDQSAYREWLEANEGQLLAQYMSGAVAAKAEAARVSEELDALRKRKRSLLDPFYKAQRRYFDWLYQANRDAWYVLDPVITVHPERLLFEAFSQDESTYCAVSGAPTIALRRVTSSRFHGSNTMRAGCPGCSSKRSDRGPARSRCCRNVLHRLCRSIGCSSTTVAGNSIALDTCRKPRTQLSGRSIFSSWNAGSSPVAAVKPDGSTWNRVAL